MWTLEEARNRLSDRLSESSPVFWSPEQRRDYINDAQRLIAVITRGVEHTITHTVSRNDPIIPLPNEVVNSTPAAAWTDDRALAVVTLTVANMHNPNWRSVVAASPLWVVPHFAEKEAYVTPRPKRDVEVTMVASVYPDPVEDDADLLFNGQDSMQRYLSAFLNIAAAYALMKERYDGDAERYYQMGAQELAQMGISPEAIPPFEAVANE